jgi:hypothetical protein
MEQSDVATQALTHLPEQLGQRDTFTVCGEEGLAGSRRMLKRDRDQMAEILQTEETATCWHSGEWQRQAAVDKPQQPKEIPLDSGAVNQRRANHYRLEACALHELR